MRVAELLFRQRESSKIAIKYGDTGITYCEWYRKSFMLSEKISDSSTNVALFLPNSIDYAVAYFAVLFSNKTIVPLGIQSKELEVVSTVRYCEIDLIVSSLIYRDHLLKSLSNYDHKISILFIEDSSILEVNKDKKLINKSEVLENNGSKDDVAIMLHTSGTTSNPKRVMLTHKNLISNIESNITSLKLTEDDRVLISMPMFFGYCNTAQFLTHLYLGASMVILKEMFFPKKFFHTVQEEKITNFTGVPSMLLLLLEYRNANRYDIDSLRYICFGGSKMPIEKLKELIRKFNTVGFVQTYGQTEASPRVTALLPVDSLRKIGSVGLPIPNVKVKVINERSDDVNCGEVGEIVIQGENIMKGYYKYDTNSNESFIEGWLRTGDLGYVDNESYLYLVGRKRNMIISGGINIYPEEIEEILLQHPKVQEVCVLPEEHYLLGEVPIAKVVLKSKLDDVVGLREYCFSRLSDYKIPTRFESVKELNKTYNGKIKRQ